MGRVEFRSSCLVSCIWRIKTDSVPIRFIQIHPDLLRPIHSNPNSLSLTQIHRISIGFALTHIDSCNLTQICSALCSFTQIRSDSHNFTQSHPDSLNLVQICSDPFSRTQIHSDSLNLASDSLWFPQTHSDSLRFIQICSDLLRQIPIDKSWREKGNCLVAKREQGRQPCPHFYHFSFLSQIWYE